MELSSVVLDGSGIYGLSANDSRNVRLANAQITHCTYGAVSLSGCENVTVASSHIYQNEGLFSLFSLYRCAGVRVTDCLIEENSAGSLASCDGSREVVFDDCTFSSNWFGVVNEYGWQGSGGAVFVDCSAQGGGAFPE